MTTVCVTVTVNKVSLPKNGSKMEKEKRKEFWFGKIVKNKINKSA